MNGTGDYIIKGIRVRKTNMYMLSHMYNFKLYVFHTHNVYDTKIEGEYLGRTRKLTRPVKLTRKGEPGE